MPNTNSNQETGGDSKGDRLLKAYAQKRRREAEPSFELRGPARAALQEKVAQQFAAAPISPPAWALLWTNLWPRLALGCSILILLMIVSANWLFPPRENSLGTAASSDGTRPPPSLNQPVSPGTTVLEAIRAGDAPVVERLKDAEAKLTLADNAATSNQALAFGLPVRGVQTVSVEQALSNTSTVPALPIATTATSDSLALTAATTEDRLMVRELEERKSVADLARRPAPTMVPPNSVSAESRETSLERLSKEKSRQVATSPTGPIVAQAREDLSRRQSGLQLAEKGGVPAPASQPTTSATSALAAAQPLSHLESARPEASFVQSGRMATPNLDQSNIDRSGSNSVYFSNADPRSRYRRNFNSPPPLNVLNSFQMQREGANIRLVDADGSVYEGPIQTGEISAARKSTLNETPNDRGEALRPSSYFAAGNNAAGQKQNSDAVSFRAVGTNRSLNQIVVFQGNIVTEPATALGVQNNLGGFGGGGAAGISNLAANNSLGLSNRNRDAGASNSQGLLAQNSVSNSNLAGASNQNFQQQRARIEGRVSVGGKTELNIDAQQVTP